LDKRTIDQAEGLRRLLAGRVSRIVAVAGGPTGVGCTQTAVNLAAALAALGKDVLVVDERTDAHSASATLCGAWLRDGENVRVDAGFSVYAASHFARAGYSDAQLADFIDGAADIVLVDTQLDADGAFSALAREAHSTVLSADASAVSRRVFERAGFSLISSESVLRDGVSLPRFHLCKPLHAANFSG